MTFGTLGSCIAKDIITKYEWNNKSNNVGYSFMACVDNEYTTEFACLWEKWRNDFHNIEFEDVTSVNLKKIEKSIYPGLYERIKADNPDYIIMDLTGFRFSEYVFDLGQYGQLAVGTNLLKREDSEVLKKWISDRIGFEVSLKVVSINDLDDEELDSYIYKHIKRLSDFFGRERLIFFRPRLVCNYLDGNQIKYTTNFHAQGTINDTIDRIYRIAYKYISYIDAPDYLVGDVDCLSPSEFHFSMPYYDYLAASIEYIIQGGAIDEYIEQRRLKAGEQIYESYNRIFCEQIIKILYKKELLTKDIVLIARSKQFAEMLYCKYDKQIFEWIYYDENSSNGEIKEKIENVISKTYYDNLIFVSPEIFNREDDYGLYYLLTKRGAIPGVNWFKYNYNKPIVFDNFVGKFNDVYNNCIETKSRARIVLKEISCHILLKKNKVKIDIMIHCNGYININESKRNMGLTISCRPESKIIIGENNSAPGLEISSPFATRTYIGDENMFSFNIRVQAGDGHAIFEKKNSKSEWELISDRHNKIVIKNHVWIGYSTVILAGTHLEDGSIVGCCSIVNKKFPNNVVIAGAPARVVRKNVSWSRNPLLNDIEQDLVVYENWTNETADID